MSLNHFFVAHYQMDGFTRQRCMPTRETHAARYRVIARMRDAQEKMCN